MGWSVQPMGWSSATHVTMATGIRDQRRVKVRVREGGRGDGGLV